MEWEIVIGLEIHVQLNTKTKLFSNSPTKFGAEPNTQANAIDLGLPGVLPIVNKEAVFKAIKFGLGIGATINKNNFFERKNYFYPDLPKGYQTTQLEKPIVGAGIVTIQLKDSQTKGIRIHHAHLEEDAGKSLHEDFHGMTGIDLNRAGIPLIEIVTEPDMSSAEEAVLLAKKLYSIVTTLDICDGHMSQGSMRVDVNISVKPKNQKKLGTRTETKNLNSFKFMEAAINQEINRQISILEDGGSIIQETRLYNGETGKSRAMRTKQEANDYRYFSCPDLLPIIIDPASIEQIRNTLPEMSDEKKNRLVQQYEINKVEADIISNDQQLSSYFEKVAQKTKGKLAANWILGELNRLLNKNNITITHCPVSSEQFINLLNRMQDHTISGNIGKQVLELLWHNPRKTVDQIINENNLKQMNDSSIINDLIDEVLIKNSKQVQNYKNASIEKKGKMIGFFVGQTMKLTKGKANPSSLNEILKKKLGK